MAITDPQNPAHLAGKRSRAAVKEIADLLTAITKEATE